MINPRFSPPKQPSRAWKYFHYTVLSVLLSIHPTLAQLTEPVYSVPTPDVATLGTFGEVPVSLFTGTPVVVVEPFPWAVEDPVHPGILDPEGKDYYYLHSNGSITFGYPDDNDKENDYLVWGSLQEYADGPMVSIRISDKNILSFLSQTDVQKNSSHSVISSSKELIDVFDFIIHHSGDREWAIAAFEISQKEWFIALSKVGLDLLLHRLLI